MLPEADNFGTDMTSRVQSPNSERTLSQDDEPPFFDHFANRNEAVSPPSSMFHRRTGLSLI